MGKRGFRGSERKLERLAGAFHCAVVVGGAEAPRNDYQRIGSAAFFQCVRDRGRIVGHGAGFGYGNATEAELLPEPGRIGVLYPAVEDFIAYREYENTGSGAFGFGH